MNITVYGRHHFPGSVLDRLEAPFHVEGLSDLEQIRVANIIEEHDNGNWSAVLYQNGHQHSIIPIQMADLSPLMPNPFEKAVA